MKPSPESSPRVSLILPCYNEEDYIAAAVNSLIDDFVRSECELLVADGMSTDRTREIIRSLQGTGLRIRLLDNPGTWQVFGLNAAIREAGGEIIVRIDAHCLYPERYVQRCVSLLESVDAANVGGRMLPMGVGRMQKAIASALRHPLGVGDARFHLGRHVGYVDTVYLGTFHRALFEEIGLYDANCRTNEDAELNLRILKQGRKIYLDSSIEVVYFPRDRLSKLARQYYLFGAGRCYTVLKHRRFTSFRQVLPVLLVSGLAASLVLAPFEPRVLFFPLAYGLAVTGAILLHRGEDKKPLLERLLTAAAVMTMHVSWGAGFVAGLVAGRKHRAES